MSEPNETVLDTKTVDEGTKEDTPPETATSEDKEANETSGDGAKTSTDAADGDAAEGEKTPEDVVIKQEGEEEAPTLVQAGEGNGDSKLIKELDDETPKTFPQVVSHSHVLFVGIPNFLGNKISYLSCFLFGVLTLSLLLLSVAGYSLQ